MGAGQFIQPVMQSYNKAYGNRFVRALGNRLAAGIEPACIMTQGDSTGNETTEWFYLAMQWLAAKYPAYTAIYRYWDFANECYGAPSIVQTGTAGDAYVTIPGTNGNNLSIADNAALDGLTGDLEVIIKLSMDDWAAGTSRGLIGRYAAAPNMGWCLYMAMSNQIGLTWSANGTDGLFSICDTLLTTRTTNGQPIWIKATLDVDNEAGGTTGRFYTSTDGATWSKLGGDTVGAGTTSIFANNVALEIGGVNTGTAWKWAGKFYRAVVKDGIGGPIVASPDASNAFPAGITSFLDGEGNTVTVNGTATVGNGAPGLFLMNANKNAAGITYATDATRFAKQTQYEPQLAFINFGHNDKASVATYQSIYEGLCTQHITAWPNVGVVGIMQNVEVTPVSAAGIKTHAQINRQIAQAMAKNDYGMVDAYRAFVETGSPATYIDTDGVHPLAAGSALWAQEVEKFMMPAIK